VIKALGILLIIGCSGVRADVLFTTPGASHKETTQTFVLGSQIVFVQAPSPDWNLFRVLPSSKVRLELADNFEGAREIVWTLPDNSKVGTGDQSYLEISVFEAKNNGSYAAQFRRTGSIESAGSITLEATPLKVAPLKNLSSRTTISPQNPALTAGVVVGSEGARFGTTRLLLVRAIGPALADFGVESPLSDPRLRVFKQDGEEITPLPDYYRPPIGNEVGGLLNRYYLQEISSRVGAFPVELPSIWTDANQAETVHALKLPPGIYTFEVRSQSGGSGDVLLELYEFENFAWELPSDVPIDE
jgi:hypothetical protein